MKQHGKSPEAAAEESPAESGPTRTKTRSLWRRAPCRHPRSARGGRRPGTTTREGRRARCAWCCMSDMVNQGWIFIYFCENLFRPKRYQCWTERSLCWPEKDSFRPTNGPVRPTRGPFRPTKVIFHPKRVIRLPERALCRPGRPLVSLKWLFGGLRGLKS